MDELWVSAYRFARIVAFLTASPLLANAGNVRPLKTLLAVALTALLAPLDLPQAPPAGAWAEHLMALAREALVGSLLGAAVRIPFAAVQGTGHLLDLQIGLGMANLLDPSTRERQSLLASFMGLTSMLLFLSMDGHLWLLKLLCETFRSLPAGAAWP